MDAGALVGALELVKGDVGEGDVPDFAGTAGRPESISASSAQAAAPMIYLRQALNRKRESDGCFFGQVEVMGGVRDVDE